MGILAMGYILPNIGKAREPYTNSTWIFQFISVFFTAIALYCAMELVGIVILYV